MNITKLRKGNDGPKLSNNVDYIKIPFLRKARPYFIMAPSVLLTIGILIPFAMAIYYSLTDFSFRSPEYDFIGLGNWIEMVKTAEFWHSVWVTVKYTLATLIPEMLLGMGIALLLNRDRWYTRFLRILFIFPLMVAPVIATLVWLLMTNQSVGIIEKFLNLFGLYNFPWASSPKTALFTAALIDIWVYTPFVLLLILAGLQSFPKSPFESAKIDGGSAWFSFKTLTLPMLKPFIYIALIFRLMQAMQEFSIIYALTKGGPGNTLMNLSVMTYTQGFVYLKFGKSLPYVLVLWVVIFFISKKLVANWLSVQRAASGRG